MKKHFMTLACALVISSLLVAGAGAYLKYGVLKPLGIQREESAIAMPFVLLADDMLQYTFQSRLNAPEETQPPVQQTQPEGTEPSQEATVLPTEATTVPATEVTLPPETTVPPTQPPTEPPTQPTEPRTAPVDVVADPDRVPDSWFDDALFIGDSRTFGLYSAKVIPNADYFAEVNMNVFVVQNWTCWFRELRKTTLEGFLTSAEYGKVFIHLGLNECGYDHGAVLKEYRSLVDLVQQHQPNAKIIIQAVMSVNRDKAMDENFSLERIQSLNSQLYAMAQEEGCYWQDVNTWIADSEGYMYDEATRDGCHPYAKYYVQWGEWIKNEADDLGIE